jgi:hypothetical protein
MGDLSASFRKSLDWSRQCGWGRFTSKPVRSTGCTMVKLARSSSVGLIAGGAARFVRANVLLGYLQTQPSAELEALLNPRQRVAV